MSSSSAISSSSNAPSSSSSAPVSSSSRVTSSSSATSSSASSSSKGAPSSSAVAISSSATNSSSSEIIESSSSEHSVYATLPALSPNVQVQAHDSRIYVYAPLPGQKIVRMFSLNGQLLFERVMDGEACQFLWPRYLGKRNLVISVSQGSKTLFMKMVR